MFGTIESIFARPGPGLLEPARLKQRKGSFVAVYPNGVIHSGVALGLIRPGVIEGSLLCLRMDLELC